MTAPLAAAEPGWQRLDPRMLLVYPIRELIRFLPALAALFIAGTASGGMEWWNLFGVAIPVALGVLRYVTTSYRIAHGRIELRRGLVNRHLLSTPLDRVRTVDITAPLVHRLLGLTSVRVGTGTASSDDDDRLDLDGLPVAQARALRTELLHAGPAETSEEAAPADRPVVEFDPAWLRFAPLTSAGVVIAAGVLGVASQVLNTFNGFERLHPERIAEDASSWSVWVAIPAAVLGFAVLVSVLSVAGYLVTNWGFRLTHTAPPRAAWHLRRGLLTTRETTLDDARVRGVSVSEPIGLRAAGGARASAIVTGLDRSDSGSSLLVPPAPRAVVLRVADAVLRRPGVLAAPLTGHGPRARTRRLTRALGPAAVVLLLAGLSVPVLDAPVWLPVVAALGVPLALALAADRVRALGHALVDGYVVVRSGSVVRRHEALELDGVIGWNLSSTWFQRRAGLTTLVATTAGGRQSVTALDVPLDDAVALAHEAMPALLGQFLVSQERSAGPVARPGL